MIPGPAISQAVRGASRGERDPSVRLVGTGIALGLLLLVVHALPVDRLASRRSKSR